MFSLTELLLTAIYTVHKLASILTCHLQLLTTAINSSVNSQNCFFLITDQKQVKLQFMKQDVFP